MYRIKRVTNNMFGVNRVSIAQIIAKFPTGNWTLYACRRIGDDTDGSLRKTWVLQPGFGIDPMTERDTKIGTLVHYKQVFDNSNKVKNLGKYLYIDSAVYFSNGQRLNIGTYRTETRSLWINC